MGRRAGEASAEHPTAVQIRRHLERHAAAYFQRPGAARVRRLHTQERRNARLFHFEVRLADSRHPVVVKVSLSREQARGPQGSKLPDELRVLPISNAAQRGDLEHTTLDRIYQNFAGRDPRFGAIRVLDYLPDSRALVMETCPDRNLADLYARRVGPLRRLRPVSFGPALRHAGAWLRVYHALPAPPGSRERSPLRADWLASIERMIDYVLDRGGDEAFLADVRSAIRSRARKALPERLPLAPVHGDFVPRNILVGPGGRVTVLDTRAQWLAPAYEDIARFRVALRSSDLQTAGLAWAFDRAAQERAGNDFLEGYFGEETPPLGAVRLFEAQRLLAIWVAAAFQDRVARGVRRGPKALLLHLRARHVRRELPSLLAEELRA